MKKKLDTRIKALIERCIALNTRSFVVIIGDNGKDQVMNLHYILSKAQVAARPSVLWCYKKDLGFSSNRKKRIQQIKKKQRAGLLDKDDLDPFELFIGSTEIRYTYYHETDRILGNTYGMCVLQDFEAITPNTLARTVETVSGGGMVVLLLRSFDNLKQFYTMSMDVHQRYRTESHQNVVARFNERFLLSLATCKDCLVLDDALNVLPISSLNLDAAEAVPVAEKDSQLKEYLERANCPASIMSVLKKSKTIGQARVVEEISNLISSRPFGQTVFLTAGRGRGKSAALGLAVASAIQMGYSNISVTSPSPDNLKTFFQFVQQGLDALGYADMADYAVAHSNESDHGKCVVSITVTRSHRQTVQYIPPTESKLASQSELIVIDEAAAIPLPLVRALIGRQVVLMASTINGYEGTGRALSLKLVQQLKEAGYLRELALTEPIRYSGGDNVERWLNDLLCLDAVAETTRGRSACPDPAQCELFLVSRDTLFSFHRASEEFLHKIVALFVSSHYKNSPNDLQLMSDAPAHQIFVLLGPVTGQGLPPVLCAVQVCLEGQISRESIMNSLRRGKRDAGDLVPWTLSQHFQDDSFPSLSGARVVRIATHPDLQHMGYGRRAMELLEQLFSGRIPVSSPKPVDLMTEQAADISPDAGFGDLKPRSGLPPLLFRLNEVRAPQLDWLAASFGLTSPLLRFWTRLGMSMVYLRQSANELTGEHSSIVLKELKPLGWLAAFAAEFRQRFIVLMSYKFREFHSALALGVLEATGSIVSKKETEFSMSPFDLKRLEAYSNNLVDFHVVLDLFPSMAEAYLGGFAQSQLSMSPVQTSVLAGIGLQRKSIEDLEAELNLPPSQLLATLAKIVRKFVTVLRGNAERQFLDSEPRPENAKAAAPLQHADDSDGEETGPVGDLDDDLDEAGDEAMRQFRERQRAMINSLNLKRYEIDTGDDGLTARVSIGAGGIASVKKAKASVDVAGQLRREMAEKSGPKKKKRAKKSGP